MWHRDKQNERVLGCSFNCSLGVQFADRGRGDRFDDGFSAIDQRCAHHRTSATDNRGDDSSAAAPTDKRSDDGTSATPTPTDGRFERPDLASTTTGARLRPELCGGVRSHRVGR